MHKRWVLAPKQNVQQLPAYPPLLAQILLLRGHDTPDAARAFLQPRLQNLSDPLALPDMPDAVGRLSQALARQEKIVVFGDYDADGVTATAFLVRLLRALGKRVAFFLPHRKEEGYGLSADALNRCLVQHSPQLLLVVDCGTNSAAEIAAAKQRGVDAIVLDHHQPAGKLPDCPVVNPKRIAENPPWKELCGAGLAFKLAHALLKSNPRLQSALPSLKSHLDLVALGTIADLVPLTGENRILARAGLAQLGQTEKIGLKHLMAKADVPRGESVEAAHVGFRLGPRLNAAGRLGDAQAALELLLTEEEHRAEELATFLDINNRERQKTEQRVLEEARELLRDFDPAAQRVIVLARPGWHPGVVGIVAARLVREWHRPACVLALDEEGRGRGSCRSIPGFDITAALRECAGVLERCGGHALAAGLSVRAGCVDMLRNQLNALAAERLRPEEFLPRLEVDGEISLADLTADLLAALEQLAPFGCENPEPLFCARNLELKNAATVGAEAKHLRLRLSDGSVTLPAIGFGMGNRYSEIAARPARLDAVFSVEWNEYQGAREVQLNLKDLRIG